MLAALFYGPNNIRIQEIPVPKLGDDKSSLVKISACAICSYDARVYRLGHIKVTPPVVLGHELCGQLTKSITFPSGKTISAGTRVAVLPTIPCLNCVYCNRKSYNLCINLKELGSSVDGGFAEYMQIPESLIHIEGV